MDNTNVKLIHSALTHFTNEPVYEASYVSDYFIVFVTTNGKEGYVEYNNEDLHWHLYLQNKLIYKIEPEVFDVLEYNETEDVLSLIDMIDAIEKEYMQDITLDFLEMIREVLQRLIEEMTQPIQIGESLKFGLQYKFYLN